MRGVRGVSPQGYRKVGRPSAPVQEPTGADSKNPDFIARRSSPEFAVNRILTASSTLRWPCVSPDVWNHPHLTVFAVSTPPVQLVRIHSRERLPSHLSKPSGLLIQIASLITSPVKTPACRAPRPRRLPIPNCSPAGRPGHSPASGQCGRSPCSGRHT